MEELDYTDPIVDKSADKASKDAYASQTVAEKNIARLRRQALNRESQLQVLRDQQDAEDVRQQELIDNPNPFIDESDYFGLITSGQLGDSLDSLDTLGRSVSLKNKDYYWNNDKVKEKFIEKYGEDSAEDMFNVIYEEIDNQYYNHIAKHSLLSNSGLNTAIFVDEMTNRGGYSDYRSEAMALSSMIGYTPDNAISVAEVYQNRGTEFYGDFYKSDKSSREMSLDFYKDPDTGQVKQLTEARIEELENREDFVAFKYDQGYLSLDDRARGERYVTIHKKGDHLLASDQLVSAADLGGGFLSNNARENPWYKTMLMAIPKFGTELSVGSAEAVNNIAMVGSALLAGDSFTGSEWETWLTKNEGWLRSHKISKTDEAMSNPYTSLDGLTDLVVNVTSQFAAAYLAGGAVGWVARGAMRYNGAKLAVAKLGQAKKFVEAVQAGKKARSIQIMSGRAGNIAGKALMTSMAMGDIYQVGKESGLSPREAASVASLAYGGLWFVLNMSENIWKPFDLKRAQKQFINIGKKGLKNVQAELDAMAIAAEKAAVKKNLTGAAKDSFIKRMKDKVLVNTSRNIVTKMGDRLRSSAPKLATVSRDAVNEALEESSELIYQESLKNSYNMVSELWHDEEREVGTGKFFGATDDGYFTQKMDELIQSFIGGFLGGGMMGAGKVAFRTEPQIQTIADITTAGQMDQYVKVINDGFRDKDSRLFAEHEYKMTTQAREDGDKRKGRFMTTEEAPDAKSIAETKRDLLLEEVNHLQTSMEIDGVKVHELQEKIDADEAFRVPTILEDYSKELKNYIIAINERDNMKSTQMASTDNAIAQTAEESEQKSDETRKAMEDLPQKLANIDLEIQEYVKNMDNISNGVTILNIVKNKKLESYDNLNDKNKITGNKSLFDNLNAAQASEKLKEDSRRKQRVERAKNLHTVIQASMDNLNQLSDAVTGTQKEETDDGTIDHGIRYLYENDKKSLLKELETKVLSPAQIISSGSFEEDVREKATTIVEESYDRQAINKEFNIASEDTKATENMELFLKALTKKRVNKLVSDIKTSKAGDNIFTKLSNINPIVMVGDNITKDRLDRLDTNMEEVIKNNKDEGSMIAYVDSLYTRLDGMINAGEDVLETIRGQFDEVNVLYEDAFDNSKINSIITKLNNIKNVDDQEGDIHISDIIDKYVNINGDEYFIDPNQDIEDLVHTEAKSYQGSSLSDDSGVYLYKDDSNAARAIHHIDAQIESMQLTTEFAGSQAIIDARLRSAQIRKGIVEASTVELVLNPEIKDAYDDFESFFSTMYFDPLRYDQLLNKRALGSINSVENEEIEDIENYLSAAKVTTYITDNFPIDTYNPKLDVGILVVLKKLVEATKDAGPGELKLEIDDAQFSILEIKAALIDETGHITDGNIPFGNKAFSEELRYVLPSPIGQYVNLLRAKNDMKFFVENAENNKNIGEIGLTLKKQDKVYTDSLKVYSEFLSPDLITNEKGNYVLDGDFIKALTTINAEMTESLMDKDEITKEKVANKFNIERDFLRLLSTIIDPSTKEAIITSLRNRIGTGLVENKFNKLDVKEALGIIGEVMIALEYNVDNFFSTYRELLLNNDIAKLTSGTPDALQEKAALMVAGFLGSKASDNTDTRYVSYLEGALATGKSTYALGVGLKVHQINNPKSSILLAANNKLQIENIKTTSKDFKLNTYDFDERYDLIKLVNKLEYEANVKDGGNLLKEVDVIVFDEATMIDAKSPLNDTKKTIENGGTPDNFFRISNAIASINKQRTEGEPKLKLLLVGDSNQNGFEAGFTRLGALYTGDKKRLKAENISKTSFQYNIGNYTIFGIKGRPSLIRSRNLEAQYRSVSAEIPETVSNIKEVSVNTQDTLVEDFSFTTKYGYSESEKKFLGVNVQTMLEDFTTNEEYLDYIEARLKTSTSDSKFTVGIGSSNFSIEDEIGNMKFLKSSPRLHSIIEANPKNFILGTHTELQGSSYSLMVVDMDKKSFQASTDHIDKDNDRRILYTSVGRGIEHVVIINNDKYTNIIAGHRDNTVRTNSMEVIKGVVDETRQFTISKLENTDPSEGIKPVVSNKPVTPEPKDDEGWTDLPNIGDIKRQQKALGNSSLVRSLHPDSETPVYHHYTGIGVAADDSGTMVNVDVKFEVDGEEDLIEVDGVYMPANEGGIYYQEGTLLFNEIDSENSKEIEKPLEGHLSLKSIEDNLEEILEEHGYHTETTAVREVYDAQGNLISTQFSTGYTSRKLAARVYGHDAAPFKNESEAVAAQEQISKTTSVKNQILDIDGVVSLNKLLGDNIFGYQSYYNYTTGTILGNTKLSREERNYRMNQEYNKEVRTRLNNVNNYTYKLMLITSGDSDTTVHIVSYKNGIKPLIIGNFIQNNSEESNYEIVKILEPHIEAFNRDIETGSESIKTQINKNISVDEQEKADPENIYKYRLFDYTGRMSDKNITAGSVIDIKGVSPDGELTNEVQEALQIIKYDPAYASIRPLIFDAKTGEYIKNSLEKLQIPIKTLVASLENKNIHVAKELLIQINTAASNVGGVRLMFNQVTDNPMKTSSVIDPESRLLRTKVGQGMNGFDRGWGMVGLSSKGFSLSQALEMLGINEDMSFNDLMTRTKTVEMIELFSTVGRVLGEVIPNGKLTDMYKQLVKVNDNIRDFYPQTSVGETSDIFTTDNLDEFRKKATALYADEKTKYHIIQLHNVIVNMFHQGNLGRFIVANGMLKTTTAGTNGRMYLADNSYKYAPIKYITPSTPEEEQLYMPGINFSINNLFKYIASFNNHEDPNKQLFTVKTLVGVFDSILKGSKFTNGIYLNLDKIENKKAGPNTYDAIAQANKVEGVDNLDLFYTSTVGLSNPNLIIPLEKIQASLSETIKKEEDPEEAIKTTLEDLNTSFNEKFLDVLEESSIRSAKMYKLVNSDSKELAVDTIYEKYFAALINEYESDIRESVGGDPDIDRNIKDIKAAIIKKASQIDNPADPEDITLLKGLNITSLEDIVSNWEQSIQKYTKESKETPSIFVILGEGSDIIQDLVSLDKFTAAAKKVATATFPSDIAEQIHSMIDAKKDVMKVRLDGANQLTPTERIDVALTLKYLDKVGTPSAGMSIQKILLNIKTIDFELESIADIPSTSDTIDSINAEALQKLEELNNIPKGSTVNTKGVISIGSDKAVVVNISDVEKSELQKIDRSIDLNTENNIAPDLSNEQRDTISKITNRAITRTREDLLLERDNKIHDLDAFFGENSKGSKIKSVVDKFGEISYIYLDNHKNGNKKGKKVGSAKVQEIALQNATTGKNLSIPLVSAEGFAGDVKGHRDAVISEGKNPFELSLAYTQLLDPEEESIAIEDIVLREHGFTMPLHRWTHITGNKIEDIDIAIQKNYLDMNAVDRRQDPSLTDVDADVMQTIHFGNVPITEQHMIDHAEKYPTKTEYDKERKDSINDLEIKIKDGWGLTLTPSIANKIINEWYAYDEAVNNGTYIPDQRLNEILEKGDKSLELTVKRNGFLEALQEKAPEPVDFHGLIEENWLYEGLSSEAVKDKWREKAKGEPDQAKKDLWQEQYNARDKAFGTDGSFEESLLEEIRTNPDLDIYEFAKGKETKSPQANYIRSVVPHIQQFLLSNIEKAPSNRIKFLKKMEDLNRTESSETVRALLNKNIADINKKINYIKRLPTFGSAIVTDIVSTNVLALETLIDDLQGITIDDNYKMPDSNVLSSNEYTDDEYKNAKNTLLEILKDNEAKTIIFNKLMSYENGEPTDTALLEGMDAIMEGEEDPDALLYDFITELNAWEFRCPF